MRQRAKKYLIVVNLLEEKHGVVVASKIIKFN